MARGFHLVAMVQYSDQGGLLLSPTAETIRVERVLATGEGLARPNRDAFHETNLSEEIRGRGIDRVFVSGLTTTDSVRATVLGSLREGFETWLVVDAIADRKDNSVAVDRALVEMRSAGAAFGSAGQLATILKHQPQRTALVVVGLQSGFEVDGANHIDVTESVANLTHQLIEFGCRQIHRSPHEIFA
jgi:nicotinamidase-related amidase